VDEQSPMAMSQQNYQSNCTLKPKIDVGALSKLRYNQNFRWMPNEQPAQLLDTS
jgi:hypothetical protein